MKTASDSRLRTLGTIAVVAIPPLMLAVVGISHPMILTAQSAEYWRNLHIAILPVFPLLGFAPWLIVRGYVAWVSWLTGALGFLYAAFYTALDVLAGIGAGGLKLDDMGMATGTVFGLGDDIGRVGSIAFIAAVTVAAIVAVLRSGGLAIPGGVMVLLGSVLFYDDHIFFPEGVLGQFLLAVGWTTIVLASRAPREVPIRLTPAEPPTIRHR
ncbi:hypothetical protein [Glaciihabitans sp. dw_435]|uniref:hypothetical protein n=1 Tax=Glaciihabitans sp. dw_435 TaxID=2720081 RepID=UPI001BD54657|nr:hypothetical protein [Glaciihabitans sp. dw_435]